MCPLNRGKSTVPLWLMFPWQFHHRDTVDAQSLHREIPRKGSSSPLTQSSRLLKNDFGVRRLVAALEPGLKVISRTLGNCRVTKAATSRRTPNPRSVFSFFSSLFGLSNSDLAKLISSYEIKIYSIRLSGLLCPRRFCSGPRANAFGFAGAHARASIERHLHCRSEEQRRPPEVWSTNKDYGVGGVQQSTIIPAERPHGSLYCD